MTRPTDEHDQRLTGAVHPADWANPRPKGRYNLVVIGGGTAGLVTAAGAAGLGAKVALIEKHFLGGDCLNVGCVPSKAMIASARAAAEARRADELGVDVDGVGIDFPRVMERMRKLRADLSPHDSADRFTRLGVDVYFGLARFTSAASVEVGGQTLRFAKACIATGSRPSVPPIPGLAEAGYLTNETVFDLTELPRRLAVIGAGPIGCELAQTFVRLGSTVLVVETEHGVMPREDRDAAAVVRAAMEREGVRVLCCGRGLSIAPGMRLVVESHGVNHDEPVDAILVATGRGPNVQSLNLEAAGVRFDEKRGVEVDDRLRTSNRRVFAAGDVCLRHRFTHAADAAARIVIRNALFGFLPFKPGASDWVMPWCTYTDPELAQVGATEAELHENHTPFQTQRIDMTDVDRAVLEGRTDGFVKVHTAGGSDRILGATIVGAHAGELIAPLTAAMTRGLGLRAMSSTIFAYPTLSEAARKAGDAWNRGRLTPRVSQWMQRIMRWQR